MATFSHMKKQNIPNDKHLQDSIKHLPAGCDPRIHFSASPAGVSNCYVFKSRLQEYAQKVGLSTPTYETIREGPSHEPIFRSTVVVGGARYDSLLGFTSRKAAEQSAAEVALVELSESGDKKESISVPVHETGLCKNLLQEYAQKMNFAIPNYICQKDDSVGRSPLYSCVVEIGGIQYIGAAAKTKKEAEIKAARTALLAIRSSGSVGGQLGTKAQYTVVPCKRKVPETAPQQVETAKAKKRKKVRSRNKARNRPRAAMDRIEAGNMVHDNMGTPVTVQPAQEGLSCIQGPNDGETSHCLASVVQLDRSADVNQPFKEASAEDSSSGSQVIATLAAGHSTASNDVCDAPADSSVPLADPSRGTCLTNIIQTRNDLPSMQLDTGVDQGGPGSTMTSLSPGGEGNDEHSTHSTAPSMNAPSSQQPLLSDSVICEGESAPSVADTSNAGQEICASAGGDIIHPSSSAVQGEQAPA